MRRSPDSDRWYVGCHEYWSMSVINQSPVSISEKTSFVRSRKVSKPRDLYLELSDRSKIWQALRQHCCRCACQISKRYDNLKYQSRGFEISRDLTKRRLFGYWDGALGQRSVPMGVLSTSWWQPRDIYLMTKSLPYVGYIITHVKSSQCLSPNERSDTDIVSPPADIAKKTHWEHIKNSSACQWYNKKVTRY